MKVGFTVVLACAILLGALAVEAKLQNSLNGPVDTGLKTVGAGTRFLATLEDPLTTQNAKVGDRFRARTLEPLQASDGTIITPGLEIRGHVDKVEAAHQGRARMWLTFDEIRTPSGWVPVVADLVDIPGVHSVKVDYDREGEIEARTSKRQEEAEAAAAGALVGQRLEWLRTMARMQPWRRPGAATGFMVSSGLGQEFTLAKSTKLELILDRPLYAGRM